VADARESSAGHSSPGSLYAPAGRYSDLARDLRSFQLHDLVTIVVSDRASAVARGATNTGRKSNAKASVTAALGEMPVPGSLSDLLRLNTETQLQGQGETSRETTLTTTLSARVTHVLPNGYLVVEGTKELQLNSERQKVSIRGVIRPYDVSSANMVRSDRLAHLEVRIDGKGVVGDAIRRPNFLYRLLLGILPF
jgi:flagellar L-ring protein precursor FlgH